jgi:hypothetical protein
MKFLLFFQTHTLAENGEISWGLPGELLATNEFCGSCQLFCGFLAAYMPGIYKRQYR